MRTTRRPLAAALALCAALPSSARPSPPSAVPFAMTDAGLEGVLGTVLADTRLPAPSPSSRAPVQARVIGADEIAASGARDLAGLLRSLPGVVLYDQVGNEFQPTLDLRGFNASPVPATIVLVDGVRVNEPDFGQTNFQLIPLSDVERVEVLPGPQTLYGPGAMGGVVSVTTKRGGARPAASASAEAGSWGRQRYAVTASGPAGPLAYRLSASRETEDGWRRHSRARVHLFDGRLDYRDAATEAALGYRFGDDDLEQAGSLTAAELGADRRQYVSSVETDSLLHLGTLSLKRRLTDATSLSFVGDARRRLENTPLNRGRTSVSTSRSSMFGLAGTLQLDDDREVLGRRSALSAGAELARDDADATSAGSFGGFPFLSASNDVQRRLGVFAQESVDLIPRVLVLTAGARADRQGLEHRDPTAPSNDGSRVFYHVSPRVGLDWSPADGIEAFAALSDSFRAPTADEIDALGPFSSAPRLKPVRARGVELGARAKAGSWGEASLSLYRTVVRDEIFPVFDPTAGFGRNTNLDKTRRDGLEAAAKARWGSAADAFADYGYTEATFQSDFVLDKAPFPATQRVRSGAFLPQVPRHRLAFGGAVHPARGASVGLDELCVSSQFVFGDESDSEPRLGGYCVLGGGASYERGAWRLFARVENLLDRRYETRGILGTNPTTGALERYLTPAPGISFSAGMRWRIGEDGSR